MSNRKSKTNKKEKLRIYSDDDNDIDLQYIFSKNIKRTKGVTSNTSAKSSIENNGIGLTGLISPTEVTGQADSITYSVSNNVTSNYIIDGAIKLISIQSPYAASLIITRIA